MGYRSEVAIVLWKPHYDELCEKAKNVDFNTSWLNTFLNNAKFKSTPDETYVLLEDEWVKWYRDYPEVSFIMSFLNDHRHTFIEIGEDTNDITWDIMTDDDEGNDEEFYELIGLLRQIDTTFFD